MEMIEKKNAICIYLETEKPAEIFDHDMKVEENIKSEDLRVYVSVVLSMPLHIFSKDVEKFHSHFRRMLLLISLSDSQISFSSIIRIFMNSFENPSVTKVFIMS